MFQIGPMGQPETGTKDGRGIRNKFTETGTRSRRRVKEWRRGGAEVIM